LVLSALRVAEDIEAHPVAVATDVLDRLCVVLGPYPFKLGNERTELQPSQATLVNFPYADDCAYGGSNAPGFPPPWVLVCNGDSAPAGTVPVQASPDLKPAQLWVE
jgi:hypothetical protein